MKAVFTGKDFKTLVSGATRFPNVGSFGGSELVALTVKDGKSVASMLGVVLAWSEAPATGDLTCSVDESTLVSFASLCTDGSKVSVTVEGNETILRARGRDVRTALGKPQTHKIPSTLGLALTITSKLGDRVKYLADVAFDSASRQELCCVMLADSDALACNPKTVASLRTGQTHERMAVPLLLAKNLSKGDTLYLGKKESVLKTGSSLYSVPSPVRAQKEFPIETIRKYGKMERVKAAECDGTKLAARLRECSTILAAKTDVRLSLMTVVDGVQIYGKSGQITYQSKVPVLGGAREMEFSSPLDAIVPVIPLLENERITLTQGPHGELFLVMESGWVMFSAYKKK